ncbi:MAG: XamI family restriction endonuclease [Desulfobacteria bacterium]
MSVPPPVWTSDQLDVEVEHACGLFRRERLAEPLEKWKQTFDVYQSKFKVLFEEYGIADPSTIDYEDLVRIFRDNLGDALRYLSGPPISADDLTVIAEASLAPTSLQEDPESAKRVLDVILQSVDPRRFPWIVENRKPTDSEKSAAILASTALITAQRVSTYRRNKSKADQENLVRDFLRSHGFQEVDPRPIPNLHHAPNPGEFCGECMVGERKADVPARLFDGRLMPIECKVSNSTLNSVKRINNDAAVKAKLWKKDFGAGGVVPVAVLSGVFKTLNLLQAQDGGLTLFWAHRLEDMWAFIDSARTK